MLYKLIDFLDGAGLGDARVGPELGPEHANQDVAVFNDLRVDRPLRTRAGFGAGMGFPFDRKENDPLRRRVLCVPIIDRHGGRFPLLRQIRR